MPGSPSGSHGWMKESFSVGIALLKNVPNSISFKKCVN